MLSKSPGLEQICAEGWVGQERQEGLEMSLGSGRRARLVLRGGAEVLWPSHKGPVVPAVVLGVWEDVGGL